ncbi:membrane cofactor protein-like isoform X2 [Hemibagrus wyckioides]|uniref:membrane cofactor protein-like isoform X2 n=1 Tax=Hemibagrus wyckioides TaxID=337641 RepID=UPI00266D79B7|nr:membrane cofactor protein-like isoform X2 [Hemibagrus wyckioides]
MLRYIVIFSTLLMMAVQVRAQCGSPDIGENRIMIEASEEDTFPEGFTIKYKCATGYVSVRTTSKSITCNGTQWSDLQLECKKKSCGNPGELLSGKYIYQPTDGILFGAVITAECLKGYQLVGNPTRNCRENGWDGRHPTCEVVKCLPPPGVKSGMFEPEEDSYQLDETVQYSCEKGFHLFGATLLTCSSNGTFEPAPPRCLRVSCERLEIPHADRIEGKSPPYTYRQFVRFQCHIGYKMEGSDILTCEEAGWNPPPPRCNAIVCDSPVISNGVVSGGLKTYNYNDQVQISCNKGYRIVGHSNLTCKEQGWSPSLPHCIELTCNAPKITRAVIVGGEAPFYKYNSSLQVQCNKGYQIEGTDRMTCKENGWNPPPPKCNIVTCSPPPSINNGQLNHPKQSYEYGQTVTYSCNKGFQFVGDSKTSCNEYGRFYDPPQCLVVCDEPKIDNGFIIGEKSTVYVNKASVQVQCKRGYHMKGFDTLTCEENGWNPAPPQCHFSYWIWILVIVVILIVLSCAVCCYIKFQKSEESTHGLWAAGSDDGML